MTKKDNPNAFKNLIGPDLVLRISKSLKFAQAQIQLEEFEKIGARLQPLEMKNRVEVIREGLYKTLPPNYSEALKILLASLKAEQLKGFDLWPYTDFIKNYGLNDLNASLQALKIMTQLFTGEFAVRPFLAKKTAATLSFLEDGSKSKNKHIRRWASEGTRPRLPWGERLDVFIKNPDLNRTILENLKYDNELYVRKSVANHINDISKDNPDYALSLLKSWQKAPAQHKEKINWITRHALRSLIKSGHPKALALIGAKSNVKVQLSGFRIKKSKLRIGEPLHFQFKIKSQSKEQQKLVVDYAIHFLSARKKHSKKVFKLKTFELLGQNDIFLEKKHSLKPITTRKYYSGEHWVEIQVNGRTQIKKKWHLL